MIRNQFRGDCLSFAGHPDVKTPYLDTKSQSRNWLHGEPSFHSGLSNHYIVTPTDKYIWYSEQNPEQYFRLDEDPREEGYSDGVSLKTGCTPVNHLSILTRSVKPAG